MRAHFFHRYGTGLILGCALYLAAASAARAQVLYDGSLGTLPASQGWSYVALGPATQTLTNGAVVLDTSAANSTYAGYSPMGPLALSRTNSFTLWFTAQIAAESHANTNRADFSVIVLGDDKRGIELGFWTNLVFAQSDQPALFVHAEDAAVNTAAGFADYALTLRATNYVLQANGVPILSGPIRDYTSFSGPINPYSTPNFIFMGDDTTSAQGVAGLKKVILVTPPSVQALSSDVISWAGISNITYTVQASSNLLDWANLGTASSATSMITYTNPATGQQLFYRVTFP